MKKYNLLFALALAAGPLLSLAQTSDDDALKFLVRQETDTYCKKDSAGWTKTYLTDPTTIRTFVNGTGVFTYRGWSSFGTEILSYFRQDPKPFSEAVVVDSNYAVEKSGDLAFLEYDQSLKFRSADSAEVSHELRTLKRINGEWKIVSATTISRTAFDAADSANIENSLNGIGYRLLFAGKYKPATEVFALNIKLSPKSWNVYDSMGEAYMKSGNKAMAIKNYETSIKLNPKNDNGAKMLAELKKK